MNQKTMIGKVSNNKLFKVMMAVMSVMVVVVMVVQVGLSVYSNASNNAQSVLETISEWRELDLPGTGLWQVRATLSQQWWLGPVRPSPPLDPLEACGIPEGVSGWWSLLVNPGYTRRLLTCLDQHITMSKADHEAFKLKLWCVISAVVISVSFFASLWLVLQSTKLHDVQELKTDEANTNDREETEFVCRAASADEDDDSETFHCRESETMKPRREKSNTHTEYFVKTLNNGCENFPCNEPKQTESVPEVVQEVKQKRKKRKKKKSSVKEEKEDMYDDWEKVCKKKKKKPETHRNKDEVTNTTTKQTNENNKKENNNTRKSNDKPKTPPDSNGGVTVRRKFHARESYHSEVGNSWKEKSLKLLVRVPPNRRQHVIGPKGETIDKLRKQYPNVGINVPPPQDKTTQHVTLEGPKTQVTAAQHDIAALLKTINAQLRENAKSVRSNITKTHVEVSPHMRHYVVGPAGEELIRLSERYPGVRVSVPPIKDKTSTRVTIRGHPSEDVMAVRDYIKAHVDQIKLTKQGIKERIKEQKEKRKQRQEFIKQKQLKNATTRK